MECQKITPEESRGLLVDALDAALHALEQFTREDLQLGATLRAHIGEHMSDEEVEQIHTFAWGIVGFVASIEFDSDPEERASLELRGWETAVACDHCAAHPTGFCIVCSSAVERGRWTCSESCSRIVKQARSLRFQGQRDSWRA